MTFKDYKSTSMEGVTEVTPDNLLDSARSLLARKVFIGGRGNWGYAEYFQKNGDAGYVDFDALPQDFDVYRDEVENTSDAQAFGRWVCAFFDALPDAEYIRTGPFWQLCAWRRASDAGVFAPVVNNP